MNGATSSTLYAAMPLRTRPRPQCLLCGASGRVVHAQVPDRFFGVPGSWTLKRCIDRQCGLVWQDPMVVDEDLAKAYDGYYTTHAVPAADGGEGGGRGFGAGFYFLDRWAARLLGLGRERQRHAASYLDDAVPGALLDVGCGNGDFMASMQARGWSVRGTDFDPAAAATARRTHGVEVDVGELSAIGYPAGAFDAVTVRHVVEHVREPVAFLAECWRILKPGGRLVLITPNVDSLGHRHFGERWRGLEQPRHLFLFAPASMRALCRKAGVDAAVVGTSAQGAAYVLRASCVARRGALARAADQLAVWWLQLVEAWRTRRGAGVGEELVSCAVKP